MSKIKDGDMTLRDYRDYFAAKAMQGMLAHPSCGNDVDEIAEEAYCVADAMLKAREDKK